MAKGTNDPGVDRLGDLESDVMQALWRLGEANVRQVQHALQSKRSLAYTTVMTVLSRLAEKGLLDRRKQGRAFVYSPASSREKVAGSLLRSLIDRLYAGQAGQAIAYLLGTEAEVSDEELERLEQLIQAKRKGQWG